MGERPPPPVFVSVASKEVSLAVSLLESTLRSIFVSVDSKRVMEPRAKPKKPGSDERSAGLPVI
jgi:hypothetical protein